jgi:hypothetical protein
MILCITQDLLGGIPPAHGSNRSAPEKCLLRDCILQIDGDFDNGSNQALIAFQKMESRKRTGKLTRDELSQSAQSPFGFPDFSLTQVLIERLTE